MEGGGVKDSLKEAAKRVLKAAIGKGKEKLGDKAVDVGKKAIDKLSKEAEKRGVPAMVTSKVADRAKDALEKSEGSIKTQINKLVWCTVSDYFTLDPSMFIGPTSFGGKVL